MCQKVVVIYVNRKAIGKNFGECESAVGQLEAGDRTL
jgi:hypothetical protein